MVICISMIYYMLLLKEHILNWLNVNKVVLHTKLLRKRKIILWKDYLYAGINNLWL